MKKFLALLLLLILPLSGCSQADQDKDNSSETKQQNNRKYTIEMYNKIEFGCTYEQVKAILGSDGEASVNNERLKQYIWTNEDESNISATFYDNKLTAKSQGYLGHYLSGKKAVTMKMYNKIKEGMMLKEVSDILGDGTERLSVMKEDKIEIMMGWDNSDGSGVTVTFLDGIVTDKDDIMLK